MLASSGTIASPQLVTTEHLIAIKFVTPLRFPGFLRFHRMRGQI